MIIDIWFNKCACGWVTSTSSLLPWWQVLGRTPHIPNLNRFTCTGGCFYYILELSSHCLSVIQISQLHYCRGIKVCNQEKISHYYSVLFYKTFKAYLNSKYDTPCLIQMSNVWQNVLFSHSNWCTWMYTNMSLGKLWEQLRILQKVTGSKMLITWNGWCKTLYGSDCH